jgi:Uma2 family endonuclease
MLTMEEFLRLPELPAGKRELIRGELLDSPPAKYRHSKVAHLLYEALKAATVSCGTGGDVLFEAGYRMGTRHWLQPDLSVTHPNQAVSDYLEGPPLLAVEVTSESNTAHEIDARIEAYLAHGAAEVWIVYPDHMWVHGSGGRVERQSGRYASPLFGGQIIDLDRILA